MRATFRRIHWSCLIPNQKKKNALVLTYFHLCQAWRYIRNCNDILTDMVYGTSTEFSEEFLSTKCSEILNYKWPQMKYVVPWDTIPLFYYHNLRTQQLCFYSSAKATGSSSNNQNLQPTKLCFSISNYKLFICLMTVNSNINMNCSIRTLLHWNISQQFCMRILFYNSHNETDTFPLMTLTWSQCLTIIYPVYHVKNILQFKRPDFTPNLYIMYQC